MKHASSSSPEKVFVKDERTNGWKEVTSNGSHITNASPNSEPSKKQPGKNATGNQKEKKKLCSYSRKFLWLKTKN